MSTPLAIDLIRTDGGTQARAELNQEVIADYREKWESGFVFDPIEVFHDGTDYWPSDGFHRLFSAIAANRASIPANVKRGTQRDAIRESTAANKSHGLRRNNADKRKAVTTLLNDDEWVLWSDNKIAEHVGVSHVFVAAVRRELVTVTSSPAAQANGKPREGRDGKTRTTQPSKPSPKPPETQHAREPGDESEATGADPVESIVRDELEREVPKHLRQAHEAAAQIKSVATKLDAIKRDVKELVDLAGGVFLPLQQIEIAAKELKGLISHSRYWTDCPRCKGKPKSSCDRCDGHGFLPFSRKGQLSAEDRAYLGLGDF